MKKLITLILVLAATSTYAGTPYAGASVGYLRDSEQAFFAARVGSEVARAGGLIHSVEGEVGIGSTIDSGLRLNFVPVMANYRLTGLTAYPGLSYYAGAGAGMSRQKLTGWVEDDAWAFALQAFGGVELSLTPSTSVTLGARYIWINNYTIANVRMDADDDIGVELGFRVRL
jgi:opacity protein-like surface antigen